jgi:methionyl-tRNA synthetase
MNIALFLQRNPALVFAVAVWSVVWKGLALWRAARRNDKLWYVVLLVVNTVGVLEIIYLFLTRKETEKHS